MQAAPNLPNAFTMHRLILSVCLLSLCRICAAQYSIVYADRAEIYKIGQKVAYFEDPSGVVTLDDILRDPDAYSFNRSTEVVTNFANTRSAIWGKVTVSNLTNEPAYLLIDYPALQHVTFYYWEDNGGYWSNTVGYFYPLSKRDLFHSSFYFKLPHHHGHKVTYYFRIKSDGQIVLPLLLGSTAAFSDYRNTKGILTGFFTGIILISIISNFLLYLAFRERFYIHHLVRIACLAVVFDVSILGVLFRFAYSEHPVINEYYSALAGVAFIVEVYFCMTFLKTKQTLPILHKGLYALQAVGIIIIFLNLLGFLYAATWLTTFCSVITIIYLLVVALAATRKKYVGATYYLIGTGLFLSLAFVYILMLNGVLPVHSLFSHLLVIGVILEILTTTVGLGHRVKLLRMEKERERSEKLHIIKRHNQELELKIVARTHEIAAQNEEITAQNEELVTQHELISSQNKMLESQNQDLEQAKRLINLQNEKLTRYNENLELLIHQRTEELKKTNNELIQHNQQLEQFSYITAHNLRAPVARLMGLINLLKINNGRNGDEHEITEKIDQTSRDLDGVIHDITGILEIKRGFTNNYEPVLLQEKLNQIKSFLEVEILRTNVSIVGDFSKVPTIQSLPAYIESIFYNLISNAIKYRAHDRDPVIEITSGINENKVQLVFRDNGIGLDVDRFKEKIFGLYQRFNLNVEGKGLGLHLVKSQVEALGGTILIDSKPGKGAQFTILLPA